jgi:glycosyltransferase involved in cell wall biosynthesis
MKIAIYNLNFAFLGGGERQTCALAAHLARKHNVTIFVSSPVSIELIKASFGLDLSNVEIIPLEHKDYLTEIARCQPDLFINNSHGSKLPCPAHRGIYMCMFPSRHSLKAIDLSSYQIITANSQYTAKWIKRRWGRSSEVAYSACPDMGPPSTKEKIILNVGRFYVDTRGHPKRQDTLLHAFRQLVDDGLRDWELHLVGRVGPTNEDAAFVEWLRNAALSYPVHIRPDIEFNELQRLYQQSSIYWHATGFGTFEAIQPGRQEHFGISIIEAMSAGVVPIVLNKGGPREIIKSGVNGYLWNSLTELKALSLHLIKEPQSFQKISTAAVIDSRAFNVSEFLDRMDQIIERIMAPDYGVTRASGRFEKLSNFFRVV